MGFPLWPFWGQSLSGKERWKENLYLSLEGQGVVKVVMQWN